MKIYQTEYSILTSSFDIFISGCKGIPHCDDCHNPELWDFSIGKEYTQELIDKIIKKIKENNLLVDNIFVMGGEPLEQDIYELRHLLRELKLRSGKKVWLFTRFNLKDIPNNILYYTHYVKCGRYISDLKCNDNIQHNVKLSTSNQKIYRSGLDY